MIALKETTKVMVMHTMDKTSTSYLSFVKTLAPFSKSIFAIKYKPSAAAI